MNIRKYRCSLASLVIVILLLLVYAMIYFSHRGDQGKIIGPSFSVFPSPISTSSSASYFSTSESTSLGYYHHTAHPSTLLPKEYHNTASIPKHILATLAKIDAGSWPPHDHSGTHGGTRWSNREHLLPNATSDGNPIRYQEWDVNIKQRGYSRDAERIVTGSDGSAYYTIDHYRTFVRIR